jgi:hypothetical protein
MVLGEIKVNLVLASSTKAGIINQSSNQIRRNTTLFSLAQRRSINLYYPSYEVYSRLLKVPSDPPALAYLLAAFPPSTVSRPAPCPLGAA